jgi:hypothetical protein
MWISPCIADRVKRDGPVRRTARSSHPEVETKCNELLRAASTRFGSGQVSAASGSTLLRSRSHFSGAEDEATLRLLAGSSAF